MKTHVLAALLGMTVGITLGVGWPRISQARPVYVCERADGTLTVTNFPADVAGDPAARTRAIDRTRQKGVLPEAARCWDTDDSTLPPRYKPDPRDAAAMPLPQRHQWRRGAGQTVILNPAIKSPHGAAFRRALPTVLSPGRQAVVTRDPQGAAFLHALTRQDWPVAKALLADLATRTPPILTPAEITSLRALAADYDIDLGP